MRALSAPLTALLIAGALVAAPRLAAAQTPPATPAPPASSPPPPTPPSGAAQAPPPAPGPASAAALQAPSPTEAGFHLDQLTTPGGLTADAAAARAVQTAPSVDKARAAADAAAAGARQAFVGFFPTLTATARYTHLSHVNQGTLGSGITPEQEAQAQALIDTVTDPAAKQLFQASLQAQIATANFTFPQVLDQFSVAASAQYPVSDVFLRILPSYRASIAGSDAARYQIQSERDTIALQAREAFYDSRAPRPRPSSPTTPSPRSRPTSGRSRPSSTPGSRRVSTSCACRRRSPRPRSRPPAPTARCR